MSITVHALYGICIDPGDRNWEDLEKAIGQCRNDGTVGYAQAGAREEPMTFLALAHKEVPLGEYEYHPGEHATATDKERYLWNRQLFAAARVLDAEILDGPGWFTMPSED